MLILSAMWLFIVEFTEFFSPWLSLVISCCLPTPAVEVLVTSEPATQCQSGRCGGRYM